MRIHAIRRACLLILLTIDVVFFLIIGLLEQSVANRKYVGITSDMFNPIKESCPYQNWTSVARERCRNPDHFHCLKDEYGRIGWICREPIWVEKDRCPVFNVGDKKLDSTSCSQTRCPPYTYRSNNIDVEYVCRYVMERESSTTPFTTKATETDSIIVALIVLTLVTIIVIAAGIIFYKYRRRQRTKNNGKRQEESTDLMQVKGPNDREKKYLQMFY